MTQSNSQMTSGSAADSAQLEQRFREIARLTHALVLKEDEIEALRRHVATLKCNLADAEAASALSRAELSEMRHSTSWRISAPVRAVGRIFGR
ncbi:hypothetical protein [Sulfitobacter aestuariivivens]|uniref:Uncharacterized protein n=1 Tax=Sulfitobacter aestuariivivens TaxID=2766981 RepID=A0A927D9I4_9RHOB|nr:hypothetical protein [Sulfitobacter aestuariivivens]MBD3666224.1 hypothetical protein [Sulfitobacter aestuariivivens]